MVKIIAGLMGSSVASGSARVATPEQLRSFLSMLEYTTTSTSLVNHFCVATKAPGFSPGSLAYDNVTRACRDSLVALNQPRLDLYYFHGPDRKTPLEESCRAINKLHQEGLFNRFGVSNFHVDEVTEIVNICRKNGWILPSVYQGGYNPLSRGMEIDLLPALREYGMAFYAYSPLGGGFFSRPIEQLRSPPAGGRMDQMKVFQMIYVNDLSLELLQTLTETCDKEGLTVHESTLRWMMHHSSLQKEDGVILGGSSEEQMEQNLKACEGGPLPKTIVDCFEDMCREYQGAEKGLAYSV